METSPSFHASQTAQELRRFLKLKFIQNLHIDICQISFCVLFVHIHKNYQNTHAIRAFLTQEASVEIKTHPFRPLLSLIIFIDQVGIVVTPEDWPEAV